MKAKLLVFTIVPILLVGCGSSTSEPSEATLRKELAGPPSLKGMRDRLGGKPPAGAGQSERKPATAAGQETPLATSN